MFFLNKRLYEFYPQRHLRFVDFIPNLSEQIYFFNGPSLYIYYLLLVISLIFEVCIFFHKYCKYVIVPDILFGTWNSLSVTLFANKLC